MSRASILDGELAAYSPAELGELVETVGTLHNAADDGTLACCQAHARIQTMFAKSIQKRMRVERRAMRTAKIMAFPRKLGR